MAKKTFGNPPLITIYTFVACILFGFIGAPFVEWSDRGGAGTEFFAEVIHATIYIVSVVSILSLFIYKSWTKTYWYKQAVFIAICLPLIIVDIINLPGNETGAMSIETIRVGSKDYEKIVKYYGNGPDSVRNVSFMLNGKKDSTWTEYKPDGGILKQVKYKQDVIVKTGN